MLTAFAVAVHRRAKLVLVLAAVAVVAMGVLGAGAFAQLKGGGFDAEGAPSTRAGQIVDDTFGGPPNLVLLVQARTGSVDAAGPEASGTALAEKLAAEPGVHKVTSYWQSHSSALRSKDGTSAEIVANVDQEDTALIDHLTTTYARDNAEVTVEAGGGAVVNRTVTSQVRKDLARAELIAIPLTLLLLVLAFGGFVAAMLPLAVGLVAILGTFAELAVLGRFLDVSVFGINLTTALGLALGVDYALLMVARYRELAARGADPRTAVVTTVRTAGRTILFSAATVIAALSALLVFPLYFLRSFAYAGIGVVAVAAVAALVLVPALLTVLGHRVEAGRLPWSKGRPSGGEAPFWGRLAGAVMRRPLVALAPLALLLVMAGPLTHAVFGTPDQGVLPPSSQARQTSDQLRTDFAGDQATSMQVVVKGDPGALPDELKNLPHVVHVTGAEKDGTHLLTVYSDLDGHSTAAQDLVGDIRALPAPHASSVLVTGDAAKLVDTKHAIGVRLPYAAGLVGLTTLIVLFLFTGSVAQPIRALILNLLGISASIGTMVWVFQDGHFASWLGFTPRPMDTAMTVALFCIAFGLSMDYEVFLTSRIKELHDAGAGPVDSVTQGLSRTGRIVSTAAGLLAVSFFAFGTASVSFLQMFGIGCGLAILMDALLIRGILVPAAMRLLGRHAWSAPRPLRRLHDRIGLSDTDSGTEPPRKELTVVGGSAG
ncbi:MMPL family transporter [Streptomyces liangshanensis]|uniref:MMPL family transporter n=1 Tax=Streptomyces liangshanensis TaxID=2717324 RepID=A0A6G9H7H1_9ACTN|nr:efflux RND transporter permease subunit [Streptomyces liangshanensis]QIQ06047.1 MMPL family transporter [Streptomyces liangshanensis]